ncbi:hypothetical protein [uncultured Brevundimonas sp.]|uniref:hypothetical protein n=1 Tax=uncultured Brevundimonas sp. TaxID=213418 RepID=UPI0025E7AF3A|nr:hypothetical protein [uncultured Brevundimonas sp.]
MATVTIDLVTMNRIADEKAERGIRAAALQGEQILKADLLNRPGTGRTYPRGNGRIHKASAPGATPARDSGRLINATQADSTVRRDGDDLIGRVVENTEYAEKLEVGTERMAARPHLTRLRDEFAPRLTEAFIAGAKG